MSDLRTIAMRTPDDAANKFEGAIFLYPYIYPVLIIENVSFEDF